MALHHVLLIWLFFHTHKQSLSRPDGGTVLQRSRYACRRAGIPTGNSHFPELRGIWLPLVFCHLFYCFYMFFIALPPLRRYIFRTFVVHGRSTTADCCCAVAQGLDAIERQTMVEAGTDTKEYLTFMAVRVCAAARLQT